MQLLFIPIEIVPHCLQVFTFDFRELTFKNIIKNIKRGINNTSNKILPKKLIKKFNPKNGINIRKIIE
tara:strand:+ start:214 stop:417 length:204 start_codon:yes stop_codon:yes gene_type:complete